MSPNGFSSMPTGIPLIAKTSNKSGDKFQSNWRACIPRERPARSRRCSVRKLSDQSNHTKSLPTTIAAISDQGDNSPTATVKSASSIFFLSYALPIGCWYARQRSTAFCSMSCASSHNPRLRSWVARCFALCIACSADGGLSTLR